MSDFIPSADADFNLWQNSLTTIVFPKIGAWGLSDADFQTLTSLQSTWTNAFIKTGNKQNRTAADVQEKDDARKAYEKGLRTFIAQWITNNTKVPNSERERMGLTVKDGTRVSAAVPSTTPVGTIDFSMLQQHTIHFRDSATPNSKAKPAGVHGCEIWVKVDGAADFIYLATDTRTPYIATYSQDEVGKTATYRLRWVNTRGEAGPFGALFSAMIVG